jgi:glycosyltransferase involved in cell wall biosynthesis
LRLCHINLSKELRGGEVQTIALVECLAERFEQSVIVRRGGLLHERLKKNGCNGVRVLPVSNSLPSAMRAVRGIDLLHVHEGRSVQVGALCSVYGPPFVVTRRVLTRPKPNFFAHWCYGRASAVVGVSNAVSDVMRGYISEEKVTTIIDFVPRIASDPATASALQARYRGKIVIGHVGELDDQHKGQSVILEVARRAQADHPDLHFLLVGGGCDEMMLRDRARDLDNVEFVGRVDNVGDYYAAMDIFVFPSCEEALGSAILEAMSCGLPVIGSNVGGIPEVVRPDENGMLFPCGDADTLYDAILTLVRDPALKERLAAGARKLAETRRVEIVAQDYMAVYEGILGVEA